MDSRKIHSPPGNRALYDAGRRFTRLLESPLSTVKDERQRRLNEVAHQVGPGLQEVETAIHFFDDVNNLAVAVGKDARNFVLDETHPPLISKAVRSLARKSPDYQAEVIERARQGLHPFDRTPDTASPFGARCAYDLRRLREAAALLQGAARSAALPHREGDRRDDWPVRGESSALNSTTLDETGACTCAAGL